MNIVTVLASITMAIVEYLFLIIFFCAMSTAFAHADLGQCVFKNSAKDPFAFPASKILECVRRGEPVILENVRVTADEHVKRLDFGLLPIDTELAELVKQGLTQRRFAMEPDLSSIEQRIGRTVRGVRLVREQFAIVRSEIDVEVSGPETSRDAAEIFAPLVFTKLANFAGTRFNAGVELSFVQFMGDALFSEAKFATGSFVFINALFAGEADFQCLDLTDRKSAGEWNSLYMRSAIFLGRLRFNCRRGHLDTGAINLTETRVTGASIRFDDITFRGDFDFSLSTATSKAMFPRVQFKAAASFNGTTFSNGAVFNEAEFEAGADFRDARFAAGTTASFDGAKLAKNGGFRGTHFAAADFPGLAAPNGSLDFTGAVFDGDAKFHGSTISAANFEDARFNKGASFALATLGLKGGCGRAPTAALNLDRAGFEGVLDFVSTRVDAPINFSHANFKPGELLITWDQLDGRIRLEKMTLTSDPGCPDHKTFLIRSFGSAVLKEEFYRRLEDNFRKRGQLSDATWAYFWKEEYARENEAANQHSDLWTQVCSGFLWLDRWVWGYGGRPGYVLRVWAGLIAAFAVLYLPFPIVSKGEAFGMPRLELASLPIEIAERRYFFNQESRHAGVIARVISS